MCPDRYYLRRKQHREKQETVENEVGPESTMRRKRKVEGDDVKWGLGYLLPAARQVPPTCNEQPFLLSVHIVIVDMRNTVM